MHTYSFLTFISGHCAFLVDVSVFSLPLCTISCSRCLWGCVDLALCMVKNFSWCCSLCKGGNRVDNLY